MDEVLELSKIGLSTVSVRGQAIHSRYDPSLEAERYVSTLSTSKADVLLLIEPALGYLLLPLRRRFPLCRIIALHCSDFFVATTPQGGAYDDLWYPGHHLNLMNFLESRIPPDSHCRMVEWRPSSLPYGRAFADLLTTVTEFLVREAASRRTASAFGRRWVSNALRNLYYTSQGGSLRPGNSAIVVAAAGPSLETTLPAIRAARTNCFVIAVSSALEAFAAQAIFPDLILGTDGGNWAKLHLHCPFRRSWTTNPYGAYNITAAVPGASLGRPFALIADQSKWQFLLLEAAGCPFLSLPQRGTVAATAIDLALSLTDGPIYLTGFDLAFGGCRTHARPHAFDMMTEATSSRLSPLYDRRFMRGRAMGEGKSLDIYAQWFKTRVPSYVGRIALLGNGHSVFDPLPRFDRISAPSGKLPSLFTIPLKEGSALRGIEALLSALKTGEGGVDQELSALLPGDVETNLKSLIKKILGNHHGDL